MYIVSRTPTHSVAHRAQPIEQWVENNFRAIVRNWDPDVVWPLFSTSLKSETPRSKLVEAWHQYSNTLGSLKYSAPPVCAHGVMFNWPWVKIGADVLYKCTINASFEGGNVMIMIDLMEKDQTWEIQQLGIYKSTFKFPLRENG